MNTLDKLENSRNLTETHLLMFPEWFDKTEYKVYEYLQGGTMCKEKGLTMDWFNSISFVKHEKCQIRKEWFIQCLAQKTGSKSTTVITLIKKV